MEIQSRAWDRFMNVVEISQIIESQPSAS